MAERGGFFSKWRDVVVAPYQDADKVGGHAGLIREFVHCVKSGAIPETVCTDNIKSLAMVFAAIESAQTRKVVRIESEQTAT